MSVTTEEIAQIKKNLDKLIEKFEIDTSIISGLKNEAFIGGSIVVQAIMNVKWNDSDLDLFVKPDDVETVKKKLFSVGYVTIKTSGNLYPGMKVHKFGKYSTDEKGQKRPVKVDIVEVSIPYEGFFASVDFDICSSRFNGEVFTIVDYAMAKKGVSKIVNSIKYTINPFKLEFEQMMRKLRLDKYKKRGITFL